jgi:hypothetical protein
MLSIGPPTSTVRSPKPAAAIGPMVLPHAMSLRDTKCCGSMPARAHAARKRAALGPSVA